MQAKFHQLYLDKSETEVSEAFRAARNAPGATGITKRLLDHWRNPDEFETRRFFFCQLEALETLIWLSEAPDADKLALRCLQNPSRRN